MRDVYISADNILSPLGSDSAENFGKLTNNLSGIKQHGNGAISATPFYASLFENDFKILPGYTKFEQLLIGSIQDALAKSAVDKSDKKTILIISSTKGNISLLENESDSASLRDRISLHTSAKKIAGYFGFLNTPIFISNACISGILAMMTAMRLIQSGQYDHAVVAGADVISKFVLSGFQSFQAVSSEPCKPFDEARTGISLGEGAATIIFSSDKTYSSGIKISGGSVSNDANHISGPSRTGEELCQAIEKSMQQAEISAEDIDLVCAHGTATLFNDEMEAKAFSLADLEKIPVNSLKGYYGHTLGAAGLIESVICIHSIKNSLLVPTLGFKKLGVSKPINILQTLQQTTIKNCLKTASGFGGCNAAIIINQQ
ncbi:MAG: beta-ketoacyl synthase N-terminal-like domain-containing protein [Ferruginibacter sp.]